MTYLILLPHMPALFVTSLIQNAGQKMAALKVSLLSKVSCCFLLCLKKKNQQQKQNQFLSIKHGMFLRFRTPLIKEETAHACYFGDGGRGGGGGVGFRKQQNH